MKLDRALQIARIIGALCFAVFCLAGALTALQMREIADKEANNADAIAQRAVVLEQDADDTLNDLHKSVQLVPKVLNDTRLTLDNANKAAIDERMYFEQEVPGLMARVNTTVDQATSTLAAYQKTGEALTAATQGLQPVEDNAALTLAQIDNLVADPDIKATIANLAATSDSTASMAKHADGMAADGQQALHSFLHPGWKTKALNWAGKIVHVAGGWF